MTGTRIFNNTGGEALVGFEPHEAGWHTVLTYGGRPVFLYGNPCGTCGFLYARVGSPSDRITDDEGVELLGDLETVPTDSALQKLARVLPRDTYYASVLETRVRRVEPGSPEDFFSHDMVRLFGTARDVNRLEHLPPVHYRLIPEHTLYRSNWGFFEALLTGVVMPLHDPARLSRERVEEWKVRFQGGRRPTLFALSILDTQSPAVENPGSDPTYSYAEQVLLTNFLLDGHHRIQAAAELDAVVRVLAMVSPAGSSVSEAFDFARVLDRFRFERW